MSYPIICPFLSCGSGGPHVILIEDEVRGITLTLVGGPLGTADNIVHAWLK